MEKKKEIAVKLFITLFLIIVGIVMVFPIAWMISASFKFESDVFRVPIEWIPENPNFENYITALTDFPYINWYINTIIATACIVFLVLFVSSLSGYAFAKMNFKGKNLIFMLFIATMMVPVQVRTIPQFLVFQKMGLINELPSIILPWAFNGFSIFMMRQFFMSIPNDLLEAARIDGSGEYRTFFKIVMPLAKSQLAALFILSFTWGWNEYFGPLVQRIINNCYIKPMPLPLH